MRKYFLQYIAIQLLTVIHVVIRIGNKVDFTEAWNIVISKLQKIPEKCENIKSTYCISYRKKLNSIKKGPQRCKISFYSKDIPTFKYNPI